MKYLVIYYEGNENSIGTCCVWSRLCSSEEEAKKVIAARGFGGKILFSPNGWGKTRWGDYKNLTTGGLVIL